MPGASLITPFSHSPPLRVTILLASTILSGLELFINGIIHYVPFQMWLLLLDFLSAESLYVTWGYRMIRCLH